MTLLYAPIEKTGVFQRLAAYFRAAFYDPLLLEGKCAFHTGGKFGVFAAGSLGQVRAVWKGGQFWGAADG